MDSDYVAMYDATDQAAPARAIAQQLVAGRQAGRVLDLGCGTGGAALVFAAAGWQVVGVDPAPAMLAIAQARAAAQQLAVTFCTAAFRDYLATPPTQPFDMIICLDAGINTLLDEADLTLLFRYAAAQLTPGGRISFTLLHPPPDDHLDPTNRVIYDGRDHFIYTQQYDTEHAHIVTIQRVWFVREIERWWRGEATYQLRMWRAPEVATALAQAGLHVVGWQPSEYCNVGTFERGN